MDEIRIVAAGIFLGLSVVGWLFNWTTDPQSEGARKKLNGSGKVMFAVLLVSAGIAVVTTIDKEKHLRAEADTQRSRVELRDSTKPMPGSVIDMLLYMSQPQNGFLRERTSLEEFVRLRVSEFKLWTGAVPPHGRRTEIVMAVARFDLYMRGLGYRAVEGTKDQLRVALSAPGSTGQMLMDLVAVLYEAPRPATAIKLDGV